MDQRESVRHAADRLFFPSFSYPAARCCAYCGRRPHPGHWEPPFCVLPGGAASARKAELGDGGPW